MNIHKIHELAMENVHFASLAESQGKREESLSLYKKAFELEKKVALAMEAKDENTNLIRTIYLRSAASLALMSNYFWEAESLTKLALNTDPHPMIKEQLEEILEQALIQKNKFADNPITQITGILMDASASGPSKVIVVKENKEFEIYVSFDQISDIFKSYMLKKVEITGKTNNQGIIYLEHIQQAA